MAVIKYPIKIWPPLLFFILIVNPASVSISSQTVSIDRVVDEHNETLHLLGDGQYDRAVSRFKNLINRAPSFPGSYYKLFLSYKQLGQLTAAEDYFANLGKEEPDNPYVHSTLGSIEQARNAHKAALRHYQKSIELYPYYWRAVRNLVDTYKALSELEGAERYLQDLVKAQPENAIPHYGLGYLSQLRNDWDRGLEHLDRALELRNDLLDARSVKAVIYFYTARYDDCLNTSLEALEMAEKLRDLDFQCVFTGHAGIAHLYTSRYAEAQKWCSRSLSLAREIDKKDDQARNLGNLGVIYRDTRRYADALDTFSEALELAEAIGDRRREGLFYRNIGTVYSMMNDHANALQYFEKARPIIAGTGDRNFESLTLWSMGTSYYNMCKYPEALQYSQKALDIANDIADRWGQERFLNTVGLVHWNLGQLPQALDCYERAFHIAREIKDRTGESYSLGNMAIIYSEVGADSMALDYYLQALDVAREIGEFSEESRHLNNIGALYHYRGSLEVALQYYEKVLEITTEIENTKLETVVLGNLGNLYSNFGRYDEADRFLKRALRISREIRNLDIEANQLIKLGDLKFIHGDYDSSRIYYRSALTIGNSTRDPEHIWMAHRGLATVFEKRNEPHKALSHYQSAIDEIEKARGRMQTEEFKTGFFAEKVDVYENVIHLLANLNGRQPRAGHSRQALEYAERAKARVFLDLLSESRADVSRGVSETFKAREREIFSKISYIQTRLVNPDLSGDEWDRLTRDLEKAEESYNALKRQIRENHADYADLIYPEPAPLKRIQNEAVGADGALLEFFLGEQNSFVWVITRNSADFFQLPAREEIEKAVRDYLQTISRPVGIGNPLAKHHALGQRLYRMLMQPLAAVFEDKAHLVIVPDGVLHHLPFETLITRPLEAKREANYLLHDHTVSYSPSASVLCSIDGRTGRRSGKKQLLAFGDPRYTRHEQFAATRGGERSTGLYTRRGFQFRRLPFSGTEVREIGDLFPAPGKVVYLGDQAKEENVKSETLDQYRFIHFATHGLIEQRVPSRSGIVLTLDDDPDEDGLLQMNEIVNLDLDAELVVLSACETGLGRLVRGEGIVGLTRAFMYAGTPAVVVSLWNINDRSSAAFMKSFYQHLTGGMDNAAALQMAKKEMLESKRRLYHHPFYWAPFILVGQYGE